MTVIKTDQWLLVHYNQPIVLCEQLVTYFPDVSPSDIYRYLTTYGMYKRPISSNSELVKILYDRSVWTCVEKEYKKQQKFLEGPQVPIFIFPANEQLFLNNRQVNSISGLAFPDKLFLFVTSNYSKQQLMAIFTHEYNHVCRLNKFKKSEQDYVLLDTIVLEGIAENAVREQYGEENIANWTNFYTEEQLQKIWQQIIQPNKDISITSEKHEDILYGFPPYPKMAGYCVGYNKVKQYMENNNVTTKAILSTPTTEIIGELQT